MKILHGYWSNKKEEEETESEIKNHINNNEIKRLFISYKEIKNFKISFDENGRFLIRYSLRKNSNLKYYLNFLAQSAIVDKNTIVFLWDENWLNFKDRTINEKTKNLLLS